MRITEAADDWTADRLGALERNILRMAILELDRGEVPPEVAIDEAVTLAKRYSSEDAGTTGQRHTRPDSRRRQRERAPEERLKSAEELLDRLERTRAKLEETKDPDEAIEILSELAEIAKEVEAQLQQAKREAES